MDGGSIAVSINGWGGAGAASVGDPEPSQMACTGARHPHTHLDNTTRLYRSCALFFPTLNGPSLGAHASVPKRFAEDVTQTQNE
ncbi:unnamed protein product [Vitrella brassicaformis CCMP3155]|uniref:Uncharacterized protein n=1 Tax=Vitrella brassicaformis (strain CCMP3155) TaxID=1169540 RepID=A0A0G4G4H9_VITBC|nr:unnamed protein product [Vitrella brassicaformis CCMP3155]|eukprot:CEM22846.1 unnamed protein product [Vitrella brassicaformis CCMP3155]